MSEIRWGIIGCGDVCEVKSGPGFQKATGSRLVAVMRRDRAKAEDFARRHNVPRFYDDAQKLIDDPEVDAVYIATPPGSHCELALAVARSGKPCYVEKPMARSFAECQRMNDAFRMARKKLFVAYYRRCLPRFMKVNELVHDGTLGEVTSVLYRHSRVYQPSRSGVWRLDARESGGGLFLDVGSHLLDVLDFLFGPLLDVRGSASRVAPEAVESLVAMSFRTNGGVVGCGSWNFAAHANEDLLEVTGTRGRVTISLLGTEPIVVMRGKERTELDVPNPPHVQQPLIQTIVDELLERGSCPSTGASAARTNAVMDVVLSDYYGGRLDDFWSRPETWPGRVSRGA
jgi:predicted dehydrogenase